jgi:hypothetical protein
MSFSIEIGSFEHQCQADSPNSYGTKLLATREAYSYCRNRLAKKTSKNLNFFGKFMRIKKEAGKP